ncbi:hypothetical protein FA95DRAFT_1612689 [Auriscalpium vulgare]|uniref:Uncharacterized protein n=1 Tax=Auriscalpium vulgare TaxID=40419 RepID=A0ACB8R685_9AGAM|nr:hypothetical protein FA95DRAFT_1612689 [Auriscalpium vulgare]
MDNRKSTTSADKAAQLQWVYDHITRQTVHKKGCRVCRDFFLHASEAILVGDVTYIEACKTRDGVNLDDLERDVQRLRDRLRRRDEEITQLRDKLAAMHNDHGDDAMSLEEDHPASNETRTSKKRRAEGGTEAGSSRAEAPRNAVSEPPQPTATMTSEMAGGQGHVPGPGHGTAMGGFMAPQVMFPAPMPGVFTPPGMYAPPGMYGPPGNQPVVWPDGTTWLPNDGAQTAMGGWGGAANWAADWRPNTYTSGSRTMENNWASSSRAPDWSDRPWDAPYDHPGVVPWPETARPPAYRDDRGAPPPGPSIPPATNAPARSIPTGPRATRGNPRPPAPRRPVSTARRTAAPAIDPEGGGASSSQQAGTCPDEDEIRRLLEEVQTPGNRDALRTLGKWLKEACGIPQNERQARHRFILQQYKRPQWAEHDVQTVRLPQPRLVNDAKKWHAYLRRYPGFKRRGLHGGPGVAPMDDVLSYLRIARLVHDGIEKEWTRRKEVRDAFVLTAAGIIRTVENYQRLRLQYGVSIDRIASSPDFALNTPVTERTVVEHLARAGYGDYEAAAASHLAHAVLTDERFVNGSQGSTETGSNGDPDTIGTPIVIDEPIIADGSPVDSGNSQSVPLDVAMTGEDDEPPSPAPSA